VSLSKWLSWFSEYGIYGFAMLSSPNFGKALEVSLMNIQMAGPRSCGAMMAHHFITLALTLSFGAPVGILWMSQRWATGTATCSSFEKGVDLHPFLVFTRNVFRDAGVKVGYAIEDAGLGKLFTNEIGDGTHLIHPPVSFGVHIGKRL
jgi:hypothetical protein